MYGQWQMDPTMRGECSGLGSWTGIGSEHQGTQEQEQVQRQILLGQKFLHGYVVPRSTYAHIIDILVPDHNNIYSHLPTFILSATHRFAQAFTTTLLECLDL